MERLLPSEPVAVEFESQNYRRQGEVKQRQRLAWVAVVDTKGETTLECFVRYDREDGVKLFMPPIRFGVFTD